MAEGTSNSVDISEEQARANFEAANAIQSVASVDAIFKYNPREQTELLSKKPWLKE